MTQPNAFIHATLLAINKHGVLLMGPSGAGKSDLALRLITTNFSNEFCSVQPQLVADDQVQLNVTQGHLYGTCPEPLKGLLEVRSLGIEKFPFTPSCEITLVVALTKAKEIDRMLPEPLASIEIEGIQLPLISLDPFENSAPQKTILATKNSALVRPR